MLNKIALISAIIGYVLFIFTEGVTFPLLMIIVSFITGLSDLISSYEKEKLEFQDFVKEAFRENLGSMLSVILGIGLILLLIFG